jgi:hypothetical protein
VTDVLRRIRPHLLQRDPGHGHSQPGP